MNTASRASCGKETTSKYDNLSGNGHFAYQTSFDFDENQYRFKRANTQGMWELKFEKKLAWKILFFRKKKIPKN